MKNRLLAVAVLAVSSLQAHADTVALWDYSATPTVTKQTQSANGASFAALGVTTSFAGGVTNQALNTAGYAAQGSGSGTRGVQFNVDTTGYIDIVLTFAQRDSATASAWTQLQYTVDGSSWTTATNFQMPNGGSNPSFITAGKTYDFSAIDAVDNNPLFGVRLVTIFAPGTSSYAAANASTGSAYGTAGTIRYDNVLFTGDAIPDTPLPVPEPQTYALMISGLAVVGLLARRRRAH